MGDESRRGCTAARHGVHKGEASEAELRYSTAAPNFAQGTVDQTIRLLAMAKPRRGGLFCAAMRDRSSLEIG